jgi:hypothetical protein
MGRNYKMKYELSYENLYKYTPKIYTYIVIKNKIRETGGQYHFEFDICDIIAKEKLGETLCQCNQPPYIKDDQLKFFAMESFSRTKMYFENNPELLL